jgi:protein SCO1/2
LSRDDSSPRGSKLAVIRRAPDFVLSDQSEKPLKMSELRGNVVLVSFIFTTCNGSCPATTHRMGLVQREIKSRSQLADAPIRFLSITLDPARDTPEVLRGYMRLYDADASRWKFLTGPVSTVEKTIEAWGMWVRTAPNGQLDHPSRIFLVDAQGQVREIYNLSFMKPEWVADDIESLLHEHQ